MQLIGPHPAFVLLAAVHYTACWYESFCCIFLENKRGYRICPCVLLSVVCHSCGDARSLDDDVQLTVVLDLPQVQRTGSCFHLCYRQLTCRPSCISANISVCISVTSAWVLGKEMCSFRRVLCYWHVSCLCKIWDIFSACIVHGTKHVACRVMFVGRQSRCRSTTAGLQAWRCHHQQRMSSSLVPHLYNDAAFTLPSFVRMTIFAVACVTYSVGHASSALMMSTEHLLHTACVAVSL